MVQKVALLTAGGFAPCLSSAVGGLIERYTQLAPEVEIIGYRNGYQGLLTGDFITVTPRSAPGPASCTTTGARPWATHG
jgi:pyrophosphate--fructose-6-phosphate 1-phosphotransferase